MTFRLQTNLHRILLCSAVLLFLPLIRLHAEDVKIVKVLDSNLFELKDGREIRLAHVEAPSLSDSNKKLAFFALQIKMYAKGQFLGQMLTAEFFQPAENNSGPIPVRLVQKFLLKTVCYNLHYLESGYGKYIAEPDTLHAAAYREAEMEAKSKSRGIWNEEYYLPDAPDAYLLDLTYGAGHYSDWNGFYQEIRINARKWGSGNGFGIRMGVFITEQENRTGEYKKDLDGLWLNPYFVKDGKYFGVEPGILFIRVPDAEIKKLIWDFFLIPNLEVKAGLIKRFYLSFDFVTDLPYSPATFGLNYIKEKPYMKLWLGYTPDIDEQRMVSLKAEGIILRNLLVNLEGIHFDRFSIHEKTYGWRVGLGYVFR